MEQFGQKELFVRCFTRTSRQRTKVSQQVGEFNATPEQLSLIRGRRYNRAKRTMAEAGAMKGASDKLSQASTAEQLAEQHNVDARTIKRDGKFAEAVEATPD